MSPFIRIYEKLRGIPHQQEDSRRVHLASEEFKASAQQLNDRLRKFLDTDPIAAMTIWSTKDKT